MPGAQGGSAPRLAFVDGLRGAAALYVLLHHAALIVAPAGLSRWALAARFLLRHGHAAVSLFLVLSGFCLMLPPACDPEGKLRGGALGHLGRRARRILPPYYATLGLCWLLVALFPPLRSPAHSLWDRALPASGGGVVTAHLLLVHNISPRWIYKVEPPLWTIATEWQIYLLFPVLLAVWRRAGIVATVGSAFTFGYGVAVASVVFRNPALRDLCPWYVGLFATGMAAALVVARDECAGHVDGARRRNALGLVGAAVVMAAVSVSLLGRRAEPLIDPIVGAVAALLIVRWGRMVRVRLPAARPWLVRLLESRAAVGLGAISYSLYLTHLPVLALADGLLRARGFRGDVRLMLLLFGLSPVCLVLAYAFHWLFERPTLPARWSGVREGRPLEPALG